MSKLPSGKALLAAFLLTLLSGWQALLAQDTAQADATEDTAAQSEQEQSQLEEELILAETEADEEESPDRFIPTEEISQDLGVSFPVDI